MGADRLQLLCFRLRDRTFALDIMGIREILRRQKVTPVPHTPPHVTGVVNLRGLLIPVHDLHRLLLGAADQGEAEDPKLVVVHAGGRTVGLTVDQVLDVVAVDVEALTPVPGAASGGAAVVLATFQRETAGGAEVVVLVRLAGLVAEQEQARAEGSVAP